MDTQFSIFFFSQFLTIPEFFLLREFFSPLQRVLSDPLQRKLLPRAKTKN